MENLPTNVINRIMFYTSHPVADIVRESRIFKFMQQRQNNDRFWNSKSKNRGCPAHCGHIDACIQRESGPVWDPRKFISESRIGVLNRRTLPEEEHEEYLIAFLHSAEPYYSQNRFDMVMFWRIKEREIPQNINETLEL